MTHARHSAASACRKGQRTKTMKTKCPTVDACLTYILNTLAKCVYLANWACRCHGKLAALVASASRCSHRFKKSIRGRRMWRRHLTNKATNARERCLLRRDRLRCERGGGGGEAVDGGRRFICATNRVLEAWPTFARQADSLDTIVMDVSSSSAASVHQRNLRPKFPAAIDSRALRFQPPLPPPAKTKKNVQRNDDDANADLQRSHGASSRGIASLV